MLLRTVHSVLDRSKPEHIREIILVDDFSDFREYHNLFLAHLWGAYAIPVALSGVRRSSSVVRRVSSVSTITTRNN